MPIRDQNLRKVSLVQKLDHFRYPGLVFIQSSLSRKSQPSAEEETSHALSKNRDQGAMVCLDVAHDTGCWVVSGAGVDLGKFLKQGTMMEMSRVCLWRPQQSTCRRLQVSTYHGLCSIAVVARVAVATPAPDTSLLRWLPGAFCSLPRQHHRSLASLLACLLLLLSKHSE